MTKKMPKKVPKKMVKWCDRALMTSPLYYALCLNEQTFNKQLDRLGIPETGKPSFLKTPTSHATCHHFINTSVGKHASIVCLGSTKGVTSVQLSTLLVHEAVHIWQQIKSVIGEHEPSTEFEAYAVQSISAELLFAYEDLTGKKSKKL